MINVSTEMRKNFESQLVARAAADESFRQALVSSPRSAVEQALGIVLPPSLELRVVEESPGSVYLVLPPKNGAASAGELSDLDLESVAGGKTPPTQEQVLGTKERNGAEYLK